MYILYFQPENNQRLIEIGGKFVKMSDDLYKLLLTFNRRESYNGHYFDAKYVLIAVTSYYRMDEVLKSIDLDDPRIQMIRGNFWIFFQFNIEFVI